MPASRFILRRIERGLRGTLPGIPAQLRMAPDPRPTGTAYFEAEGRCLRAGVLILLYESASELRILLTRRTEQVLHHPGQISFPGGEQHPGESLAATALREAEEELAFDLKDARILGQLTPLYISPSNYCIYPTVAFLRGVPGFKPQADEVAEVIEVPINHLLDPRHASRETRDLHGRPVSVPFYEFRGHKIWGATAMVLAELLSLLDEA
jgi:8-oxo-dGTP pyrophosphatase MutT (NUDIX family)